MMEGMSIAFDSDPKFAEYAHPERLVSTEWLAQRLTPEHPDAGKFVLLESNEDVLLYDVGHIPGARKIDWHLDLNDPIGRDYIDGEGFAALMSRLGIGRETTVVIYGDANNWWAAYALWVFTLFGHEDVRLLDGGRAKWIAEERELTREVPETQPADYPVVERDDGPIRAYMEDVLDFLGGQLIDVRSFPEYTGERDRKSTRLNSSHVAISYAVFCPVARTGLRSFPTRRSSDLGGRAKWIAEERELTREVPETQPADYPVVERDDGPIRAYMEDVLDFLGGQLIDVRSFPEYTGERTHMPDYPQEGTLRGGHIPGAKSVPRSAERR